jgi:hypothetical protein
MTSGLKLRTAQVGLRREWSWGMVLGNDFRVEAADGAGWAADGAGWAAEGMELGNGFY